MDECDKNITGVRRVGPFWRPTIERVFGGHEWTKWLDAVFRAKEERKIGAKVVEFGQYFQRRFCIHCNMVDERLV